LAVSYDKRTKLTYGLLLSRTSHHEFHKLIQGLKQREIYCQHPLIVVVLVAELIVNTIAGLCEGVNRRLNVLEETMGQHEYANRPKGDPLELKFEETTSSPNFIGRTLAVQRMRLGSTLRNLEKYFKRLRTCQMRENMDPRLRRMQVFQETLMISE
jgi:hypothetical protein